MPSDARVCAHEVLRRVFAQDAYADRAFRSAAARLQARDRALARRIVYGSLQRKLTLEHLIERLTSRPLARLDGVVRACLLAGAYELLYTDGAPDHAIVDDTVAIAKLAGSNGSGLVNAVLRRIAAEGAAIVASFDDSTPRGASLAHSHPSWLAEMWWRQLGAQRAVTLMAANNEPAELAARVNTLLTDRERVVAALPAGTVQLAGMVQRGGTAELAGMVQRAGTAELAETVQRAGTAELAETAPRGGSALPAGTTLAARTVPAGTVPAAALSRAKPEAATGSTPASLLGMGLPEALVLVPPFDLQGSDLWARGEVTAQSRAAMLVSRVLDPQRGERVLDLCAAPGAKSTHIAALMCGEGEVVAVEASAARARQLAETVARMHAENIEVLAADARRPLADRKRFDRVLVDAPCSGLGTLQARPDLRWRASLKRIDTLASLQAEILAAAAEAVRSGGTLVYSTCTISRAENEQQIEAFLASHPDFELELPARARACGDGAALTLLTLPDRDRTAGFFIARMRRG